MTFKNPVPEGRIPRRLLVTRIDEGAKSGCVAGRWFGDIHDAGHPALFVNANDRAELEKALSRLDTVNSTQP